MGGPDAIQPRYMPILKGRMGELRALRELGVNFDASIYPLVEIPLTVADPDSDAPDAPTVTADVKKFAADLKKSWSPDRPIAIDATLAPARGGLASAALIHDLMADDFSVTPTLRPSDEDDSMIAIRDALQTWQLKTACIRLSGEDLDDVGMPIAAAIDHVLDEIRLSPSDVDLVLDFGPVQDEHAVSFAARIARLVLGEIPYADEWREVVCASAGFPPDLNAVQPEVLTELPRFDAQLCTAVRERVRGRTAAFGDYGIAYPSLSGGAAFAPAPQLRFTWGGNWLVFKGRKRDRRGSAQFYDICRRMVDRGVVDPELSWGDRYVDAAAHEPRSGVIGPGNAMMWRAIGTSHHVAYVATRLATHGAP